MLAPHSYPSQFARIPTMGAELNKTVGALLIGTLLTAVWVGFYRRRYGELTCAQWVWDHHDANVHVVSQLPRRPQMDTRGRTFLPLRRRAFVG